MAVLARLTGLQRMIRSWRTDQPTELASQLEDHQREVDEALRRVGAGAWPRLRERVVSGGAPTPVQPGELILAETWSQSATLTLPQIGGDMLGAVCGVAKMRTENEVRVFATRGRIDGVLRDASPLRIGPVGMRIFVATTKGWWSVGERGIDTFEAELTGSASIGDPLTIGSPALSDAGFARLSSNTVVRVPYPARWRVDVFAGVTHDNASGAVSVGLGLEMATSTVAQFLGHRTSATASHRVPVSGQRTLPITDPETQTLRVVAAGVSGVVAAGSAQNMNWLTISYAGDL